MQKTQKSLEITKMTVSPCPTMALKSLPGLAKRQKIVRRETFRPQNSRYLAEIIISLYNLSLIQISAKKFFNLFHKKEGGGGKSDFEKWPSKYTF